MAEAHLAAVGVSFGGPVDAEWGLVLLSHHVPGWEEMPLREWLEERLGLPAAVDNDANAGALGEHRFGAGRGYDSLMYITVSTGVAQTGWLVRSGIRLWIRMAQSACAASGVASSGWPQGHTSRNGPANG